MAVDEGGGTAGGRAPEWLLERLAAAGDRPCLIEAGAGGEGSCTWSAATVAAAAAAAAERLAAEGVAPGAVVALKGDYTGAGVALLLALAARRAITVPVAGLEGAELAGRLATAGVGPVVAARGRPATGSAGGGGVELELEVTAAPDAPAAPAGHALYGSLRRAGHPGLVLFSSGSTGPPKAMVHDLGALLDTYRSKRPRARPLVQVALLLFDHIGGLNTLFGALATGSALVLPAGRGAAELAALLERHRVNVLPASPTFLNLLLMSGACQDRDFSALRMITYGTEPMPENLLRRVRAAFPRARLVQTFGTSETGIAQTVSKASDSTLFRIDDPRTEHRVVGGELWLRSPVRVLGYLNAPEDGGRFTEDGWFRTGDLVEEADEEGFFRIVGRRADVINVGGQKVHPAEVESAILALPEVADCTVRGESNAITGQTVVAEVVPAGAGGGAGADGGGGGAAALKRAVRAHCRRHLEPYKVPTRVVVVEATESSGRFKKVRGDGGHGRC